MSILHVLLDGRPAGHLEQDAKGRLAFTYDARWVGDPRSYPLSTALPLTSDRHGARAVENFLWGLLPDNEALLEQWSRRFQVSSRNPFALLGCVGEDCAGAVQFVREDRLDAAVAGGKVEWIDEQDIRRRLAALKQDAGATRLPNDAGQFSLAGAQRKIALYRENGRWGVPSGRTPTTHILKPQIDGYAGHVVNEHFCLNLARRLGLTTARSEAIDFGDGRVIVVERYDRRLIDGKWHRIHQEDFLQALGIHPRYKYQRAEASRGRPGPGLREIGRLLGQSDRPDADRLAFLRAIQFNFLVAGTDAHAKNYSFLHARGSARPSLRMAPLYDIASLWPYTGDDTSLIQLAMRVGSDYRLTSIGREDWREAHREIGIADETGAAELRQMARNMPDAALDTRRMLHDQGILDSGVDRLVDAIAHWARIVAGRN